MRIRRLSNSGTWRTGGITPTASSTGTPAISGWDVSNPFTSIGNMFLDWINPFDTAAQIAAEKERRQVAESDPEVDAGRELRQKESTSKNAILAIVLLGGVAAILYGRKKGFI